MTFFSFLQENINLPILEYFNDFTDIKRIEHLVYFMADAPIFLLPLLLIWNWFYASYSKSQETKEHLLYIFYACVISIWLSSFIQLFVHIERPELSLMWRGKLILEHVPNASFPSDHASVSLAFLASLYLFGWKKTFYFLLPFIILMLLSRVAGGIHWPFDILSWVLVWIFSAILVYKSRNLHILKKGNAILLKIASYIKL